MSDDEAARQYSLLSDGKSASRKFDSQVYAFYYQVTALHPEIDMVPESASALVPGLAPSTCPAAT